MTALIVIAGLLVVVAGFMRLKHISPLSIGVYDKVNQGVFSDTAIGGYDPVSYFEEGSAVAGRDDLTYQWNGATWKFASRAHLGQFKADPERFQPMYGGYCSFAVSKGFSANHDPNAFAIRDGNLFVFADENFRDKFLSDFGASKAAADRNWSKVE